MKAKQAKPKAASNVVPLGTTHQRTASAVRAARERNASRRRTRAESEAIAKETVAEAASQWIREAERIDDTRAAIRTACSVRRRETIIRATNLLIQATAEARNGRTVDAARLASLAIGALARADSVDEMADVAVEALTRANSEGKTRAAVEANAKQ